MRYGTRTDVAKRWTVKGHRPACPMKYGYSYGYLYQACQPATGRTFELFLPNMSGVCFVLFLTEFARKHPNQLMILDNAGCHHVGWEEGSFPDVQLAYLPPYSPDFNPQERLFQEIRKPLKGKFFETLEPIEHLITDTLKTYWNDPPKVKQITAWNWID